MCVLSRALVVSTIAFPFRVLWAAELPNMVINEVAWMGTTASYNDEWLELYNNASSSLILDGWTIKAADGSPEIKLQGTIAPKGFYLLERTDNNSVPNIEADQIYKGALNNDGETLGLYDDNGRLADGADGKLGWPAGDNQTKQTMERTATGAWQTSRDPGGTPKAANSQPLPVNFANKTKSGQPSATEAAAAAIGRNGEGRPFSPLLTAASLIALLSGAMILIARRKFKTKEDG